jgi:flagellar basal body rod protein FlgC
MSDPLLTAVSGLQAAALRMQSVASNVAHAQKPDAQPTSAQKTASSGGGMRAALVASPPTDLETEPVTGKQASAAYRANMAVFGAMGRAYQSLIDIIA